MNLHQAIQPLELSDQEEQALYGFFKELRKENKALIYSGKEKYLEEEVFSSVGVQEKFKALNDAIAKPFLDEAESERREAQLTRESDEREGNRLKQQTIGAINRSRAEVLS